MNRRGQRDENPQLRDALIGAWAHPLTGSRACARFPGQRARSAIRQPACQRRWRWRVLVAQRRLRGVQVLYLRVSLTVRPSAVRPVILTV